MTSTLQSCHERGRRPPRRHRWVSEQDEEFSAFAVEPRTNFGDYSVNRITQRRHPATQSRHLTIEVRSLVARRDAIVDGDCSALVEGNFEVARQNEPTHLSCRDRQGPLANHR